MSETTLLLLNLDRLPDYESADGRAWFSLTISTSLAADPTGEPEHPELLKPWSWDEIKEVRLFKAIDVGQPAEPLTMQVTVPGRCEGPSGEPATKDLKDELARRRAAMGPSQLAYDPRGDGTSLQDSPGWPDLLEQAIRLPAPIGQHLNLVVIFTLTREDFDTLGPQDRLFAVPVVKVNGDLVPETAGQPVPAKALWTFVFTDAASDRRLEAVAQGIKKQQAPLDLWLLAPEWGGKNWLADLPLETAEAADLATRLANAIAKHCDQTPTSSSRQPRRPGCARDFCVSCALPPMPAFRRRPLGGGSPTLHLRQRRRAPGTPATGGSGRGPESEARSSRSLARLNRRRWS